jgi:hypothetical protein
MIMNSTITASSAGPNANWRGISNSEVKSSFNVEVGGQNQNQSQTGRAFSAAVRILKSKNGLQNSSIVSSSGGNGTGLIIPKSSVKAKKSPHQN